MNSAELEFSITDRCDAHENGNHIYIIPVEWESAKTTTSARVHYSSSSRTVKRVTKLRCKCGKEIDR